MTVNSASEQSWLLDVIRTDGRVPNDFTGPVSRTGARAWPADKLGAHSGEPQLLRGRTVPTTSPITTAARTASNPTVGTTPTGATERPRL